MSVLVYFLLTKINPDFKSNYSVCWFPYSSAELKEFKNITMDLLKELENEKIVNPPFFTNFHNVLSADPERLYPE